MFSHFQSAFPPFTSVNVVALLCVSGDNISCDTQGLLFMENRNSRAMRPLKQELQELFLQIHSFRSVFKRFCMTNLSLNSITQ